MALKGEDGVDVCVLQGAANSPYPILRSSGRSDLLIQNLKFQNMQRTSGNGGAIELVNSGGTIQGCVFYNNAATDGGAVWISPPATQRFTIQNNQFNSNSARYGGGLYVQAGALSVDISNNTFRENTATGGPGGGFYISGSQRGSILRNAFVKNVSTSGTGALGGGFGLSGSFTGNIQENTFVENRAFTGGGFAASQVVGSISKNLFYSNQATNIDIFNWGQGGGFYLSSCTQITENVFSNNSNGAFSGSATALISRNLLSGNSGNGYGAMNASCQGPISNNYFLYNAISGTDELVGSSLRGNSPSIENNTFVGRGRLGEALVRVNSTSTTLINNVFVGTDVAINQQTDQSLFIQYNDFYSITNILYVMSTPEGNNLTAIQNKYANFRNNYNHAPGIVGENQVSGVWTQIPVYSPANNTTTLSDNTKSWVLNQWRGAMLNLGTTTDRRHFPILSNTNTQIIVLGNLTEVDIAYTNPYSIDDYHLASDSLNVDRGTAAVILDDFEEMRDRQIRQIQQTFDSTLVRMSI